MSQSSFPFFALPYVVKLEVLSNLDLKDICQFALTCQEAHQLSLDKVLWKKKLWNSIKTVKFKEEMCIDSIPNETEIIIYDNSLSDLKKLVMLLEPQPVEPFEHCDEVIQVESKLIAKLGPLNTIASYSEKSLIDIILSMIYAFRRPKVLDPFGVGMNAPSFLLFGPPETVLSKKLIFSLIASKGPLFEPVGLVKGNPGGIGGGMTVNLKGNIMNFLPVRKARKCQLLSGEGTNAIFHPDVVSVARQMKGLIYYMDANCKSGCHQQCQQLYSDLHELKAMQKSLAGGPCPPILLLLAKRDLQDSDPTNNDELCSSSHNSHNPSNLLTHMISHKSPWLVRHIYIPSLQGVNEGFNWLLKR